MPAATPIVGATYVGPLVTQILQRVRDAGGQAHSRSTVVLLLSEAQQVINAIVDLVYESVTITTTPKQQLYSLKTLAPNCVQLRDVKQDGRSLSRVPFRSLFYTDRQWHRKVTMDRHDAFCQLGTDLMVIHPAVFVGQSVTLTYTKLMTDLTVAPAGSTDPETNLLEIPDDSLTIVKDLTEALVQLRERKFAEAQTSILRLQERLKEHKRFVEIQYA